MARLLIFTVWFIAVVSIGCAKKEEDKELFCEVGVNAENCGLHVNSLSLWTRTYDLSKAKDGLDATVITTMQFNRLSSGAEVWRRTTTLKRADQPTRTMIVSGNVIAIVPHRIRLQVEGSSCPKVQKEVGNHEIYYDRSGKTLNLIGDKPGEDGGIFGSLMGYRGDYEDLPRESVPKLQKETELGLGYFVLDNFSKFNAKTLDFGTYGCLQ